MNHSASLSILGAYLPPTTPPITPTPTANYALGKELLETSLLLNKETVIAWNELWTDVISTSSPLWIGLCRFGIILAALGIIVVSYKMGWDFQERRLFLWDIPASLVWPLIIILLLGANGNLLHIQVLAMRGLAYSQINKVLDYQLLGVTIKGALADMTLTANAKTQIKAVLAECYAIPIKDVQACFIEKKPIIDGIIAHAKSIYTGGGLPPGGIGTGIPSFQDATGTGKYLGQFGFGDALSTFFIGLLWACQWAFVNMLDAALLLTATLAPVFTGLSMLPLARKPIWAWASTFLGIFSAQLGYTIIIGLVATVLVKAGAQNISDLAFIAFLCIFAPFISLLIGSGGGIALFNGISSSATNLASTVVAPALGAAVGGATTFLRRIF